MTHILVKVITFQVVLKMAEYVDPFEINTVEPEKTTNETFPVLPRGNAYDTHQIDTAETHETSFCGTGLSLRALHDQIEGLYEKLIRTGKYKLENPESQVIHTDIFESRGGKIFIKDTNKQITTNGRIKPINLLEKLLSKKDLRDMGFIAPDLRISPKEAENMENITKNFPSKKGKLTGQLLSNYQI